MVVGLLKAELGRAAPPRVVAPATIGLFAGILLANLIAWGFALVLFADRPSVMATALLAWAFGLRHAVDADHMAAIDNAVRKLMHDGAAPCSAGLYFALGHSTVVVVATIVLSATAMELAGDSVVKTVGSVIGTSVSAAFLLLIATINLAIFVSLWRTFRSVRNRKVRHLDGLDTLLAGGGVWARMLGPMFRMVTKSWHLYPLGFLFGLGFDTATSIGLLSISAAEAMRGASLWSVLVLPALFASGMALVDTTDSVLMVNAYRWAFVDPLRKLWYNLTITGASVIVALFIGGIEALDLLGKQFGLTGGPWSAAANLNDSLANFGFAMVGLFAVAWLASVAVYRTALARRRAVRESDDRGAGRIERLNAAEQP